ncbi:hypothetical protein ANN_12679 [Periplaneta americana]|uniref:Uncharacterized protein n=1 Tax=Periplaneta americana TaxID=6978 RepID=A0ABQ8TH74_PERAM|nr:hypothetical protein ANN_12679 [Periplaneta americana]
MAGLCERGNEPPGFLKARERFRAQGEPERFRAERKETDERGRICRLLELYTGMASTDSMDKEKRTY